jgi:hypothetical protein
LDFPPLFSHDFFPFRFPRVVGEDPAAAGRGIGLG